MKVERAECWLDSAFARFEAVDTDGSGLIDFEEMKRMVREGLGLAPSVVSSDALKALQSTRELPPRARANPHASPSRRSRSTHAWHDRRRDRPTAST